MRTSNLSRDILAVVAAGVGCLNLTVNAAITGQWDFAGGDLAASTGRALEYLDGEGGATASQTRFGTTSALGIPDIGGQPAHVMGFPRSLPSMGYVVYPNAGPNGGGLFVNQYTLIFDLLFPAESSTQWRALIQIDDPSNANDAELFINPSGAIGISGSYQGAVQANTWHRIAFAVDLVAPGGPQLRKYIDGTLVGQQTLGSGVDGRWALSPSGGAFGESALLFTDNNEDGGHVQPGFVSSIQIHDEALSSAHLAALGAPNGDRIPATVSVPASITSLEPAPDAINVMPSAPVEVVIASGSSPVAPASASLTLNDQPLPLSIIEEDRQFRLQGTLPALAAGSVNTLRLAYTDPASGDVVRIWMFRMAPYAEDLVLEASLGTGLVAHWPLDEGLENPHTTLVTDVVSGNAGTLSSPDPTAAWSLGADARLGGALRVDGENTYVVIPASETLDLNSDQMTLALWVNLAQLPADLSEAFGGIFDSVGDSYVLYLDRGANELRFKVTAANGHAARPGIPANRLATGTWLHVAAVYDGRAGATAGEARIYLNGQLMDRHVGNDGGGGTGLLGAVRAGQVAGLGRNGDQATGFLNATLDDIAVWSRALTDDELGYLAAGRAVPAPQTPDPLTIVAQPQAGPALEGSLVVLRVGVEGGSAPFAFQWQRNGVPVADATTSQLGLVAGTDTAGTYTVVVTDASSSSVVSEPTVLTVVALAPEPAQSLTQGLAAHWPFDDGVASPLATNVVDVARGTPAFLTASQPQDAWLGADAGRFGGALRFDGQNVHVTVPSSPNMNLGSDQVSVTAWVKLSMLPSELPEAFGGVFDSVPDDYVLYLDRGNRELRFKVTVGSGHAARPGIPEERLTLDEWIHLAGVYDGRATEGAGEARIYLDGELVDAHLGNDGAGGAGLTGLVRSGQTAAIGRNGSEARYFLEAAIDDLGIWSRALSEAEIQYLAAGNAIPGPIPSVPLELTGFSVDGGFLTFSWNGGQPPFQVQRRTRWTGSEWENVGAPTESRMATLAMDGEAGFFRVVATGTPDPARP
ncbi:MAG: LamG domain-containing protein [Verrucomicrobiae bacterium]|nr:LamG domain-containing protein [Verrucomicrobiae bacterium]